MQSLQVPDGVKKSIMPDQIGDATRDVFPNDKKKILDILKKIKNPQRGRDDD